jgi:cyclopropane fatty-acyl-phospholipid synthase-like methyltransferase
VPSQWFETFFRDVAVDFWLDAMPPEATIADVNFLEKALNLGPNSRVLDVPCGGGRHSIELARRGHRVTGVDLSDDFLAVARKSDQAVEWRRADMRDLPWTSEFDGAFCFGNSFGYLDPANAEVFFGRLANALKPGGRVAIETGMAAESILPMLLQKRWHKIADMYIMSEVRYQVMDSRMDIDYTFVRGGVAETRPTSSYVLTISEIRRMLERSGFGDITLFGGVRDEPYQLGKTGLIVVAGRM